MGQRRKQPNGYVGIGLLISSACYFLREANIIPDWVRMMGLIMAIVLMLYGIVKQKNQV